MPKTNNVSIGCVENYKYVNTGSPAVASAEQSATAKKCDFTDMLDDHVTTMAWRTILQTFFE